MPRLRATSGPPRLAQRASNFDSDGSLLAPLFLLASCRVGGRLCCRFLCTYGKPALCHQSHRAIDWDADRPCLLVDPVIAGQLLLFRHPNIVELRALVLLETWGGEGLFRIIKCNLAGCGRRT